MIRDLDVEQANRQRAGATGEFQAAEEIDLRAVVREADAVREKRQRVRVDAAESEERRVLREERALLRKEKREAAEVDLTLVDLGVGEVGVDRERGGERRRDVPDEIEAGIKLEALFAGRRIGVAHEARVRFHIEAATLTQAGDAAEFANIGQRERALGAGKTGPAHRLLFAADGASDVEAPRGVGGIEREALHWNRKLGAPAGGVAADAAVPESVPLVVAVVLVLDEAVVLAARSGEREIITVALPVKVSKTMRTMSSEPLS